MALASQAKIVDLKRQRKKLPKKKNKDDKKDGHVGFAVIKGMVWPVSFKCTDSCVLARSLLLYQKGSEWTVWAAWCVLLYRLQREKPYKVLFSYNTLPRDVFFSGWCDFFSFEAVPVRVVTLTRMMWVNPGNKRDIEEQQGGVNTMPLCTIISVVQALSEEIKTLTSAFAYSNRQWKLEDAHSEGVKSSSAFCRILLMRLMLLQLLLLLRQRHLVLLPSHYLFLTHILQYRFSLLTSYAIS